MRIGGDGGARQRQRRLVAGAGGADCAHGKGGCRVKSEAPCHAKNNLIMLSVKRTNQSDAFPARRLG